MIHKIISTIIALVLLGSLYYFHSEITVLKEQLNQASPVTTKVYVPKDKNVYNQIKYAPATQVGNLLFVSGKSGIAVKRNATNEELQENFESIFKELNHVLKEAGADFSQVIHVNSWHLDHTKNFFLFNDVKAKYLEAPYPSWNAVGVSELAPGAVAEVSLIVNLDSKRQIKTNEDN